MEQKRCRECGEMKPIDEFYIHRMMADKHLNKCKECVKLRLRLYRRHHPDLVAEIDRATYRRKKQSPDFQERKAQYQQKYRTTEINRAHIFAQRYLKATKLDQCEFCHLRLAVHAHHPDYNKPFEVIWLCARCHQRLHHVTGEAHA